jgi:Zn-dependent protease
MTAVLAVVVVAIVVAVVVHEAGHAVGARLVGATTVRVRVVGLRVRVEADVAHAGWRPIVFLAAGPLANVVVAVIALRGSGAAGVVVAIVHGAFAVANLVPHGDSDGARLLALVVARRR